MTTVKAAMPLFVQLELTPEQQRRVREQTGHDVTTIPIEAEGAWAPCRFGGIELRVPRGVFMPTASSEHTFELARTVLASAPHSATRSPIVVDVGTGAGAIALALARVLPRAFVYGTELSTLALNAARRNRDRLGLRNVRFLSGSLLSPLPARLRGGVDVIVANVPYVPPDRADISTAFPEGTAVGPGADGLGLVRTLLLGARGFLRAGGSLVLQLADFQWPLLASEVAKLGYRDAALARRAHGGPVTGILVWPEAGRAIHGRITVPVHHASRARGTGNTTTGGRMSNDKKRIRIDLTGEQQAFIKRQTGIELPSVELTGEELEDRIAPGSISLNFGQTGVVYKEQ